MLGTVGLEITHRIPRAAAADCVSKGSAHRFTETSGKQDKIVEAHVSIVIQVVDRVEICFAL